nr:hypothetical protein CFP56_12332 [Quercus suber]
MLRLPRNMVGEQHCRTVGHKSMRLLSAVIFARGLCDEHDNFAFTTWATARNLSFAQNGWCRGITQKVSAKRESFFFFPSRTSAACWVICEVTSGDYGIRDISMKCWL